MPERYSGHLNGAIPRPCSTPCYTARSREIRKPDAPEPNEEQTSGKPRRSRICWRDHEAGCEERLCIRVGEMSVDRKRNEGS